MLSSPTAQKPTKQGMALIGFSKDTVNLGVCFKSNSVEFHATLQKNYQIKEIHAVLRTQCSFA